MLGFGMAVALAVALAGPYDHMQTICTSLQTDNHTNTSSLNLYRPDTFLDATQHVKALKVASCTINFSQIEDYIC